MKVATAIREAHSLDARNRDAARSASDQSDGNVQSFDDTLSDVGSDGKTATDGKAPSDNRTLKATGDATAATPISTDPAAATVDPASLGALIDALGKAGTALGSTDTAHSKTAASATTSGKRSAKDTAALAASAPADSAASTPGSDIMAMLLAGAGAVAANQTAAMASGSGAAQTPKSAKGEDGPATAATDAVGQTTSEVIVSDISVSTHLAPVSDALKAAASQDRAAAKAQQGALLPDAPKPETDMTLAVSADAPRKSVGATEALDASAVSAGATLGPTQTIARAIGDLAATPAAATTATTTTTSDVAKPFVSVARTLNLKMSPESLGTVDIRLHVTGQSLDVQLTVSSEQTLGIVSRDRDVLESALRDQNYQVNSLVIQDGGAGASSGGNNATQNGQTPSGGQRSDSQSGGGASARGDQQQQGARQSGSDARNTRATAASPAADESSRALFV